MSIGATLATFWHACSTRERAAILSAGALVAAALLYAFLWEPGMAARKSLAETLPRLRAQLEDMRWQRAEIVALRKEIGARTRPGDLGGILRASAAQAPFAKAVERIDALAEGRARMQAAAVPFDAWVAWIESLQRELGIRVDACHIRALDEPGLVRLDATFASASEATAGSAR